VSVSYVVSIVIQLYSFTILIYIIMSWFVRSTQSEAVIQVYEFLGTVCEPFIGVFRRFIPATGGLDFSPLIALVVLNYVIRPLLLMLLP
jgi:YggT family protein